LVPVLPFFQVIPVVILDCDWKSSNHFFRLFEEAKTKKGKEMALEKWEKIRPELMKLMNLEPGQDPIKVLGTPAVFQ
jgi:hypothetical protein